MAEQAPHPSRLLTVGISAVVVLTLSVSTITTPLYLDSLNSTNKGCPNETNSSCLVNETCNATVTSDHRLDNYTIVFIVNVIYFIISGLLLLFLSVCRRNSIPTSNRSYPKSQFMLIGFSDALSAIFFVYAASGSRTAPYLQSLVMNFAIPVTFIVRFVILRKKPTLWKAAFAGLVLCAEFIALLPSIFPSLETDASRKDDGGASGVAGVLWPLCYFVGFIPQAVVNVVLERSSKAGLSKQSPRSIESQALHPVYLLFWTYMFCLIGVVLLFWTNIIPGFGNTDSIKEFWNVFAFNIECFLGITDCPRRVHIFSAFCIVSMLTNRLFTILFLRFTEGANYLIITMSLQTPVVLLFWTLFKESPFAWHPHVHLSTWLSIVAIVIMLPAIFFYSRKSPEKEQQDINSTSIQSESSGRDDDMKRPLFYSTDSYQSIDASAISVDPFTYQNRDFEPVEPYYLESSINSTDDSYK